MQHPETMRSVIIKAVFEHLKKQCADYIKALKWGFFALHFLGFPLSCVTFGASAKKPCKQVQFSCTPKFCFQILTPE